jgi:hypothetical protein
MACVAERTYDYFLHSPVSFGAGVPGAMTKLCLILELR